MDFKKIVSKPGRTVAYYPKLGILFDDPNAAMILCQLIFWIGKGRLPNMRIYKTSKEIYLETALSYSKQATARAKLRKAGVLVEYRRRRQGWIEYEVNLEQLKRLWDAAEVAGIFDEDGPK